MTVNEPEQGETNPPVIRSQIERESQGIQNRESCSIKLNTPERYSSDPVQPEPNQNFFGPDPKKPVPVRSELVQTGLRQR